MNTTCVSTELLISAVTSGDLRLLYLVLILSEEYLGMPKVGHFLCLFVSAIEGHLYDSRWHQPTGFE